jgi:hypothetical protein
MSNLRKLLKSSKISRVDLIQKLAQDANENEISLRRKKEVLDAQSLSEAKEELRKEKRAKRNMKRAARWKNIEMEKAKGPRVSRKFMYKAGDLVTIKRDMPWFGVNKGDMGIVCDHDDTGQDYLLRYEEQRFLWVMGPRELERWDASWVEWTDDEEDEVETIEHDVSDIEVPDSENFEKLLSETDVSPTEQNPVAEDEAIETEHQSGSLQPGDFAMYTGPGRNLYNDSTLLEPIGSFESATALMIMEVIPVDEQQVMLHVMAGDTQGYTLLLISDLEVL